MVEMAYYWRLAHDLGEEEGWLWLYKRKLLLLGEIWNRVLGILHSSEAGPKDASLVLPRVYEKPCLILFHDSYCVLSLLSGVCGEESQEINAIIAYIRTK